MNPNYNGTLHRCGDINLVAALMSVGIPLDQNDPVRITGSESLNTVHAQFAVAEHSEDGKEWTAGLMEYWNGEGALTGSHPFVWVCDFIRARPKGMQRTDDLFGFAIGYLQERGHTLPGLRSPIQITDYISALPDAFPSYVLAFVANRDVCYQLAKKARHSVHLCEGDRHAVMHAHLPKWQKTELLSRLQG